ncbi:recombinase family protein [Pseudooceanicola sp. C21-150M6]|uniref:recombinase family protein n=1 Tax=Pseudooceanicola sp. C21-150M6 TaxID=3434355 RepID=UPI003D7F3F1C
MQRRRAAIYARYSTDLQRDRSIDDQIALCREHAAAAGLTVVTTFSDRAKTSASLIGRDGIQDLLAEARAGMFDVVVVEALDRLSRDQEDLAGIHKRLEFSGVRLEACGGGEADAIQIGVHGLLGQIWMGEHKKKVRRGLAGVISDGRNAGGKAYGYQPIQGAPGELEIVPHEAEVVRRIFETYAAGQSPRAIAAALNEDSVPAPRGARWNASTINGNAKRGHGMLLNPLYDGRIVWNRVTMVRDPETGRRVSRVTDDDQRRQVAAEHLRIVPPALWAIVQNRKSGNARAAAGGRAGHKPKRPFSGLLRCGCCGAGMSILKTRGDSVWIKCSRRKESGDCDNSRQVRLDRVEAAIFERLRAELADPVYVREYLRAYHEERARVRSAAVKDRAQLERTAVKARAALNRAHELYVQGVTDGPEAVEQLRRMNVAAKEAEAALAQLDVEAPTLTLHPKASDRYIEAIDRLGSALRADMDEEAISILRELISTVTITPAEPGTVEVVVEGKLSAILGDFVPGWGEPVVAEEGLEPPTRGL